MLTLLAFCTGMLLTKAPTLVFLIVTGYMLTTHSSYLLAYVAGAILLLTLRSKRERLAAARGSSAE